MHVVPYGHIKPSAVAIRFKYGHNVEPAKGFDMISMCSNTLAVVDGFPDTICAYEIVGGASTSSGTLSSGTAVDVVVVVAVAVDCDDEKLLGTNSGASTDKYDANGIWFDAFFCSIADDVLPSINVVVSTSPFSDASTDSGCK